MKRNIKYLSNYSLLSQGFEAFRVGNQKWPARNERTIYHNLTIGLKDLESFGKRKILIEKIIL